MPPTRQKLNDPRIARFRSLKNFDKIIDEKTVRYSEGETESHECLPCIGLFGDSYTNYATSTPSSYGGGERPEVAGKRLFPEKFPQDIPFSRKKLNKDQIQEFNTTLQATSLWKIDQFEGVIRSAKCTIMTTNLSGLCGECIDLKKNNRLKDALKSRRATPSTTKFIPKFYFNTRLIGLMKNQNLRSLWTCIITNNNDSAMWASLAQMGMNGAFNGEKTFTELASLMLQIKTKEEAGISMKGLRYSEHLTHFFSLLSESSREYEVFRKELGGMSIQRIRQIRASNTELITDPNLVLDNVTKFACIAKELKWEGPILLMTDCTKIRSKLVYSQELGYITGSTLPSSEVSVSDINDIHEKIRNIYENNALATQVRVIVLKIPIGKIPPIVIAILPTKGDESAEQIFNILCTVLDFARQNNLNILSMGADGARSEFNAQTKIMNSSSTYFTFDDPFYNVHFKVPVIHGRPLVRVQDPKHAKKTARNQLFTGARHLSLGIDTVRYDQLYLLAHQDKHTLLKRDVLNVDKQDDGAAYRMFHSDNLLQIIQAENVPSDMIGLFIYLFVLGELCDAYLNRKIDHKARIRMVMRAFFFLKVWKDYIQRCGSIHSSKWYNMQHSIISMQSFEIFISMAESLIMLIMIHREYYPHYPLFLWEHGTEALEHIFGISRQVIADFNFYEFYKIQKRVMYRDKISRAGLINTSRDRTSAGGYVFDIDGTSLSHETIECLRTWPSEDDFKEAIRIGHSEAMSFAEYLQIDNRTAPSMQQLIRRDEHSSDDQSNLEIIDDDEQDDEQCQNLAESIEPQKEIENIGTAAFEVSRLLLDESDDESNMGNENEATNISLVTFPDLHYILSQKPVHQKQFEKFDLLFTPEGFVNYKVIIDTRKNHDAFTRHSKSAFNKQAQPETSETTEKSGLLNLNNANRLITELTIDLNVQENCRNRRKERWEGRKRLATIPIAVGTNVHNIIDANVSDIHNLISGGYLIIYSDNKLCIAQIISMYEKRGQRHAWIEKANFLDYLSYISVNIYLNVYNNLWTNTCEAGGKLFAHVPAKEVLYYFNSPSFVSQGSFYTLTKESLEIFQHFKTPEMTSNLAKIFHK
ncbi:hypothetical protein RclHR1_00610003 [Rhizophagus clarus]|uniref:Uncharacterized protein n=1 Tax=Rhizophagus clarus TaxID=94130 RepID=A0A2Z6RSG1_9GLOM|nr:hypothetical protein RclHR1_00610003 [Rhizophagus clarus]